MNDSSLMVLVCVRVMWLVFGWKWMGVVHCSNGWSLVQVEVRVLWIGWF